MKKIIGGMVLLLLVIVVGAPGLIGNQLEGELERQKAYSLSMIEQDPNLEAFDFKFDYEIEKGWFSSKVRVTSSMVFKELTDIPLEMIMDMDVTHGPVLLSGQGVLGLFEMTGSHFEITDFKRWYKAAAQSEADPFENMEIETSEFDFSYSGVVGFDGAYDFGFETSPFELTMVQGEKRLRFALGASSAASRFDYETGAMQLDMAFGTFTIGEVGGKNTNVVLEDMKLVMDGVYDVSRQVNYLEGYTGFDLAKFAVTSDDPLGNMSAEGLHMESRLKFTDDGERLDQEFALRMANTKAHVVLVTDTEIVGAIRGLQVNALKRLSDAQSEWNTLISRSGEAEAVNEHVGGLTQALVDLFQAGSEAELSKIAFTVNGQAFSGDYQIDIPETDGPKGQEFQTMMNEMTAGGHVSIPYFYFNLFAQQQGADPAQYLNALVEQKMVSKGEESVEIGFQIDDGIVQLGEVPVVDLAPYAAQIDQSLSQLR